jgi:4-alpha-glucanotransferase
MNPLTALARAYGLQTAYYDTDHKRQTASRESMIAVLRSLGAPLAHERDAGPALRERRTARWRRTIEPVLVAWDGKLGPIEIRMPRNLAGTVRWTIVTEAGDSLAGSAQIEQLAALRRESTGEHDHAARALRIRRRLPFGYHQLTVAAGHVHATSLIISAPSRAFELSRPAWGMFAPLYALRSLGNWGAGDFGDLERFADWTVYKGASAVMTLPLLPLFLDRPHNPSPYSPVSRLFWNEMYIDVPQSPELERCPEAREAVASPDFQEKLHSLRRKEFVDYRDVMAVKRQVMEQLAACLFGTPSKRRDELEDWADEHPQVRDYARFRAAMERTGATWTDWPEQMRGGRIADAECDPASERYHLYAQWLAAGQIEGAVERMAKKDVSLFFDMPLGVDRAGYDVWRFRDSFAEGVNAGAPPDAFFAKGQDWGFPPLSPDGDRAAGYRYFRASLRHLLKIAGLVRIDHVMGLHRMYWIPRGLPASEGVYVRYPADELYAILCLESHRYKTAIMGEDLGTVPHFVRRAMSRHNLLRSYVLQFELPGKGPVRKPPLRSVASLNTHDMPPFAAFWRGLDINQRLQLSDIDSEAAARQRLEREASKRQLLAELKRSGKLSRRTTPDTAPVQASICFLKESRARAVLVNLEDLWQETEPQNVPGTADERPNWRRKLRYSLDELPSLPEPNAILDKCAGSVKPSGGK